jgi:hypothetical protein
MGFGSFTFSGSSIQSFENLTPEEEADLGDMARKLEAMNTEDDNA